jgi:Domain of unknown function (DUF6259)
MFQFIKKRSYLFIITFLFIFIFSSLLTNQAFAVGTESPLWTITLDTETWSAVCNENYTKEVYSRLLDKVSVEQFRPSTSFSLTKHDDVLTFGVGGHFPQQRGTRWLSKLHKYTTSKFHYYAIRYKATGIRRDNRIYPIVSINISDTTSLVINDSLLNSSQILNDDIWHVVIGKKFLSAPIDSLQVEVGIEGSNGRISIDYIGFAASLDKFPKDLLSQKQELTKRDNAFYTVDITPQCNDSYASALTRVLDQHILMHDGYNALPTGTVAIEGIPFEFVASQNNLIVFPEDTATMSETVTFLGGEVERKYYFPESRDDTITLSVNKQASEVFFMLVAEKPSTIPRFGLPEDPFLLHDIETFAVELVYANGEHEFAFPYSLADKGYRIYRMAGVYAVPADSTQTLKSIVLHNRVYGCNVALAAITINTSPNRFLDSVFNESPVVHVPHLPEPATRVPYIKKQGSILLCGNTYYDVKINCTNGFLIEKIINRWSDKTDIALSGESGIEIRIDDRVITGRDFTVTSLSVNNNCANLILQSKKESVPLTIALSITVNETPSLILNGSVTNTGTKSLNADIKIPNLSDVIIGDLDNTWMFFPKYRNVITNQYGSYIAHNNHCYPMQVMDSYNPETGTGIAIITHNRGSTPLEYVISKDRRGVSYAVQYPAEFHTLQPLQTTKLVETCLVFHAGGWHGAFMQYKNWVASWYQRHQAKNRDWFDRLFLLRTEMFSKHLSKRILGTPGIYNPQDKSYRFEEAMAANRKYYDADPDIIHFYCWHYNDEINDYQYGEYTFDNIGGLSTFKKLIEHIKKDYGFKVSLYTISDRFSKAAKSIDPEMAQKACRARKDGKLAETDTTWYICQGYKPVQDHYVESLKRIQKETGADMLYLDLLAVWHMYPCYTQGHGHRIPYWPNEVSRQLITRIREELPPHVVLWTEYPFNDVNTGYSDGTIQYYYMPIYRHFSRPYNVLECAPSFHELPMNTFRFAFPDIKQICFTNHAEKNPNWSDLKAIFFNGEALYDCSWYAFSSRCREMFNKTLKIKRAYVDCFTSKNPIPLVPTERNEVYANKFSGDHRTAWTLYNARFITVRGPILAIDHKPGATYYDAWNQKKLTPAIVNGKAIIELKMDPQELGCIVQSIQ